MNRVPQDRPRDEPETRPTETRSAELVMLDQQLALGAYLDALLKPSEAPPVETPTAETPVVEVPAVGVPVEAPAVAEETALAADTEGEEVASGAASLQVLLFQVAGLKLAVPLVELAGVVPWDDAAVTEMPNHSPWFLGLRDHQGRRVKLIDMAAVVLPPDRFAALGAPDSGRLEHIVLIDEGRWGLACEAIGEVITLPREGVKWRRAGGSRPWLAGTVIEQMCALVDTSAFAKMLAEEGPVG
ncbi:chemotaxis protein CheW [Thiohalobacter sp.]|uniref:chemotaxis protein CheW n=1 Tax=Thiohalobacter sp. TaxID=2025948 RepID=UPI00261D74AE|nr:chemotaxis protein CheW [Thiohalobacter sp.]